MFKKSYALVGILEYVKVGLSNPHLHYLVCMTHFETVHGPVLLGTLYLHGSTVWVLEIGADSFTYQVLLDANDPRHCSPSGCATRTSGK